MKDLPGRKNSAKRLKGFGVRAASLWHKILPSYCKIPMIFQEVNTKGQK